MRSGWKRVNLCSDGSAVDIRNLALRLYTRYVPGALSEVWPLSAHLEHEPLVEEMLLFSVIVGQLPLRIVLLDDVLDDGTGLP